jgi:hypothetical protein
MKRPWAFTVLICVALAWKATAAHTQGSDTQKFVMFDKPAFSNALSVLKGEKIHRVDAYGIFINGNYAGQIGDTIRIGQQASSYVKIVARTDGKDWSQITAGPPSNGKLFGLVGLQLDMQSPQNIICPAQMVMSCMDEFDVQRIGKTDVLIFKTNAFTDKQLISLNLGDFGFGPTPKKTDMKTIDVKTEPDGAEIYLDSKRQFKPTNSAMNIPFAREGSAYLSHSLMLRLEEQGKSSGNVVIKYENSSVNYNFQTGTIEVK